MEHEVTDQLTALSHPQRLAVFRLLMRRYPDAVQAGEIALALALKPSTLSAHLASLTRAGLAAQSRVGTARLYTIELETAREMIEYLWLDTLRGRPVAAAQTLESQDHREGKRNVLFLCTGNSARSIFAEAIMRHKGGERFNVYSAGTQPFSDLNPDAVALLRAKGLETEALRAKHVSAFQTRDAPVMDYVFTVCDRAANVDCAPWTGHPVTGHFSTPDPVGGSEQDFRAAFDQLRERITFFLERVRDDMPRAEKQTIVDTAARIKGP